VSQRGIEGSSVRKGKDDLYAGKGTLQGETLPARQLLALEDCVVTGALQSSQAKKEFGMELKPGATQKGNTSGTAWICF